MSDITLTTWVVGSGKYVILGNVHSVIIGFHFQGSIPSINWIHFWNVNSPDKRTCASHDVHKHNLCFGISQHLKTDNLKKYLTKISTFIQEHNYKVWACCSSYLLHVSRRRGKVSTTIRGATETNFRYKLGFCPNRLDPPSLPERWDSQKGTK